MSVTAPVSRARSSLSLMETIWEFVDVDVNFAGWEGKALPSVRQTERVQYLGECAAGLLEGSELARATMRRRCSLSIRASQKGQHGSV